MLMFHYLVMSNYSSAKFTVEKTPRLPLIYSRDQSVEGHVYE